MRDIAAAGRGGPRLWADLFVATWELARANRELRRTPPGRLPLLDRPAGEHALSPAQSALVGRVAYAIPVMGLRVPWRADCLVQALAARHWLARHGVRSDLCIGVRKDDAFEAHAWLRAGSRLVTGGEVASYAELSAPAARRTMAW